MPIAATENIETPSAEHPMLVLIAGPYLSGTGGDPAKIAANRTRLEAAALPIYQRGHLPLLGEWLALPIYHHIDELPSRGAREGTAA